MQFDIYENGRKIKQLSRTQFIAFYYEEFGTECGNPGVVADSLPDTQGTYLGRGYTAYKSELTPEEVHYTQNYCRHPNKYLNVITNSLQFYVCPDCKKEV